ncbi:methyltransferase domain protein, partial [Vibrio parahaemolyticus V-223/04]
LIFWISGQEQGYSL